MMAVTHRLLLYLMFVLFIMVFSPSINSAASQSTGVSSVSLPLPMVVVIDNDTYYGTHFVVNVSSVVCITADTVYTSTDTKLRFQFWTRDNVITTSNPCVEIEYPGNYVAVYLAEHLVVVESNPPLFTYTEWVKHSDIFRYTAPKEIKHGDAIYVFKLWSGDAVGVNETIEIPVARPLRLLATYTTMYPLYISNKLIGYFPSGFIYYYVPEQYEEGGVRRVVDSIVVVGGSYVRLSNNVYAITISGTTYVYPIYKTYYRVSIETPFGTRISWVESGDSYILSLPQRIDGEDITYIFKYVEGDITSNILPTLITVDRPMNATAVYAKMYKVTIISPTGEKVKYVEEGKDTYVYEPSQLSGIILSRVLKYFIVNGEVITPQHPGVLLIRNVTSPLNIVAIYEVEVIWNHVVVLALLLLIAMVIYVILTRLHLKTS